MPTKKAAQKKPASKAKAAVSPFYFQVMRNHDGEYYFHLRSEENYEIIASSETYKNKADCYHTIGLVKQATAKTRVEDVTPAE